MRAPVIQGKMPCKTLTNASLNVGIISFCKSYHPRIIMLIYIIFIGCVTDFAAPRHLFIFCKCRNVRVSNTLFIKQFQNEDYRIGSL